MRKILLTMFLSAGLFSIVSIAEETVQEKIEVQSKDVKRSVKKGYHKAKEMTCLKSDEKCLKQKLKYRRMELIEQMEDHIAELKGKMD